MKVPERAAEFLVTADDVGIVVLRRHVCWKVNCKCM